MASNGAGGSSDERSPLLSNDEEGQNGHGEHSAPPANPKTRGTVWGLLTLAFIAALVVLIGFEHKLGDSFKAWLGILPKDPMRAAYMIMDKAPVIVSLSFR